MQQNPEEDSLVLEKGKARRALYKLASIVNADVPKQDQWLNHARLNNDVPMLAIPGTCQGGFAVKDATREWQVAVKEQPQPTKLMQSFFQ